LLLPDLGYRLERVPAKHIAIELRKKIAVGSGGFEGKNFGRRALSKPPEVLAPSKQFKNKLVLRAT